MNIKNILLGKAADVAAGKILPMTAEVKSSKGKKAALIGAALALVAAAADYLTK